MDGRPVFEVAAAGVADEDDGTQPEDLAIYLGSLRRYRAWFIHESPAEYLGRLERVIGTLDEDLAVLDRLMDVPEGDFLAHRAYRDQALWCLFRATVAFLEVSKWFLARETPRGARPRSFSEAFARLAEQGVLPTEKLADYRTLCRLRNRFAHSMGDDLPTTADEVRAWVLRWLPELRAVAVNLRARYL